MVKPANGTSQEDRLRELTREANAATKDLRDAIRDARAAYEEGNRIARGWVDMLDDTMSDALVKHAKGLEGKLHEIANAQAAKITQHLAEITTQHIDSLKEMIDTPDKATRAMEAVRKGEEDSDAPDMLVNGTGVTCGRPVDVSNVKRDSAKQILLDVDITDAVIRKCAVCKKPTYFTPVKIEQHKKHRTDFMCFPCAGGLVGIVRRDPNGLVAFASGNVVTGLQHDEV